MKEIKTFEAIEQNNEKLKTSGINATLYLAYIRSKKVGNELIDINEVIWNYDVEEIAKNLRANGITEFTISAQYTNIIETLEAFEKLGISIKGVARVKAHYTDLVTGEYAIIPAIKMMVKKEK